MVLVISSIPYSQSVDAVLLMKLLLAIDTRGASRCVLDGGGVLALA